MKRYFFWVVPVLLVTTIAACGPTRPSLYAPTLSIRKLQVQADGSWQLQVRILNNSYSSMHFDQLHLTLSMNNEPAAKIDTQPNKDIPAHAAGVTDVNVSPGDNAASALAAIADKGSSGGVAYSLRGTAVATPEKRDQARDFKVNDSDWLSAVPGIANTFR